MTDLIEKLGLDWLPLIIGRRPFQIETPDAQSRQSEIRASFSGLDNKKVEEALAYCDGLVKREDERATKIESKAFTLIGITGIATAFITGFAGLLLDRGKIDSLPVLMLATFGYVLTVASLIFTIYLALKVVTVGDYKFTYPSASDILKLATQDIDDLRRDRAVALLVSYEQNATTVNYKATFLGGAQLWFRNSIALLSCLTIVLAIYAPFTSFARAGGLVPQTPTLAPTLTTTSRPTVVPSPTATSTATMLPTRTNTPTTGVATVAPQSPHP